MIDLNNYNNDSNISFRKLIILYYHYHHRSLLNHPHFAPTLHFASHFRPYLHPFPPFLQFQGGDRITEEGWERVKLQGRTLRIKEVTTTDQGTYVCTAINGFGKETFTFHLFVIGKECRGDGGEGRGKGEGGGKEYFVVGGGGG